ncbi:MAG: hypothetical protein ABEN55_23170 [Bradymonadaceae bacterium]
MDWTALPGLRAGFVSCLVVAAMTAAGCGDDSQPAAEVQANTCQQHCQRAADCGEAQNWQCVEGFCQVAPMAEGRCQRDRECWAKFSGWQQDDCQTTETDNDDNGNNDNGNNDNGNNDPDDGCVRGDVCILVGNVTYCAPAAPTRGACPVGTSYGAELADGSGRVAVCANQQARCEEGTCRDPCDSDADCGGERTCDASTGRCLCTADSDCAGELVCETNSGQCICENDADCTREGYGKCYDGTCGCADDAACSALGDNYTCAPVDGEGA